MKAWATDQQRIVAISTFLTNYLRTHWLEKSHTGEQGNRSASQLAIRNDTLRKALSGAGLIQPDEYHSTLVREGLEASLSLLYREVFWASPTEGEAAREARFWQCVALYNSQPLIATRTSQTYVFQQFSTPPPLCWLMGQFVLGHGNRIAYDPTAGTGMLFMALSPSHRLVANELNPTRHKLLQVHRPQNLIHLSNLDALKPSLDPLRSGYRPDILLTNPPFGQMETQMQAAPDFATKYKEQYIVVQALQQCSAQAKAAIIVGGHTDFDAQGRIKGNKDRVFLSHLYKHYGVVDVINVNGDLYRRMGTNYAIRLILIDNTQKANTPNFHPLYQSEKHDPVYNWADMYARVRPLLGTTHTPPNPMITLTHYNDPQHGWLAVPINLLIETLTEQELNEIEQKGFSYRQGQTAYLEEDQDASVFLKAYGKRNPNHKPDIQQQYTNDYSPIRHYPSFYLGQQDRKAVHKPQPTKRNFNVAKLKQELSALLTDEFFIHDSATAHHYAKNVILVQMRSDIEYPEEHTEPLKKLFAQAEAIGQTAFFEKAYIEAYRKSFKWFILSELRSTTWHLPKGYRLVFDYNSQKADSAPIVAQVEIDQQTLTAEINIDESKEEFTLRVSVSQHAPKTKTKTDTGTNQLGPYLIDVIDELNNKYLALIDAKPKHIENLRDLSLEEWFKGSDTIHKRRVDAAFPSKIKHPYFYKGFEYIKGSPLYSHMTTERDGEPVHLFLSVPNSSEKDIVKIPLISGEVLLAFAARNPEGPGWLMYECITGAALSFEHSRTKKAAIDGAMNLHSDKPLELDMLTRPVIERAGGHSPAFKYVGKTQKQPSQTEDKEAFAMELAEAEAEAILILLEMEQDGLEGPYKPVSNAPFSLEVNTPDSMDSEIHQAMADIQKAVGGDVNKFVADRLGYRSLQEMFAHFAAEQVDALSMALYNMETRNESLIVGDQTGIGKGRVAAGILRYGIKNGTVPIFITEKANLFTDIYRDLCDIGMADDVQPFILYGDRNAGTIYNKSGEIAFRPLSSAAQRRVFEGDELPEDFNCIFTTYSQLRGSGKDKLELTYDQLKLKTIPRKNQWLTRMAKGSPLVMDESHNASGTSKTGVYVRKSLLEACKGVVFLSATFAKRPDSLPVYAAKLSLGHARLQAEDLIDGIEQGGVALQEVLSAQLVRMGQMTRRERTYEGVDVQYTILTEKEDLHTAQANALTRFLRQIIAFQELHVQKAVEHLDNQMKEEQGEVEVTKGTKQAGANNTPLFSRAFNLVNQILLSIKAEDVATKAIGAMRQGKAPIIAFANTLGSVLEELASKQHDRPINIDSSIILTRALESIMRITVKDSSGNSTVFQMKKEMLSEAGQEAYEMIMQSIRNFDFTTSASPIDVITHKIEQAGFSVAEITGRSLKAEFEGDNYLRGRIVRKPKENKPLAFKAFNDNQVHCLLINQTGSTGASAHAVPTDQVPPAKVRTRIMFILQAELDINTEVQKRGRIFRTGQIKMPQYEYVFSSIPAEKRLLMMLKKKLKSLDANTTSSQKSSDDILESVDFMNQYGGKVIKDLVAEDRAEFEANSNRSSIEAVRSQDAEVCGMYANENLWALMNLLKVEKPEKGQDSQAADERHQDNPESYVSKFTGRVALADTKAQRMFYDRVTERYLEYIDRLKKHGLYTLEMDNLDYQADIMAQHLVSVIDPTPRSPFGGNVYLETLEINNLRKPYQWADVEQMLSDELGERTAEDYVEQHVTECTREYQSKSDAMLADAQRMYQRDVEAYKSSAKYKKDVAAGTEQSKLDEIKSSLGFRENRARAEQDKVKTVSTLIKFYYPGRSVELQYNLGDGATGRHKALVLGISFKGKQKYMYTPGNVQVRFAVASSVKSESISMSGDNLTMLQASMGVSYHINPQAHYQQGWSEAIADSTNDRITTRAYTGNLLAATKLVDTPKVVSFTRKDGTVDKGIFLNETERKEIDRQGVRAQHELSSWWKENKASLFAKSKEYPLPVITLEYRRSADIRLLLGHDQLGIEINGSSVKDYGPIFKNERIIEILETDFVRRKQKIINVVNNYSRQQIDALMDVLASIGVKATERVADAQSTPVKAKAGGQYVFEPLPSPVRDVPVGTQNKAPATKPNQATNDDLFELEMAEAEAEAILILLELEQEQRA